jgi:hypothetical protein
MCVYIGATFYHVSGKHPDYEDILKAANAYDADEFLRIYNKSMLDFSCEKYTIDEKIEVKKETIEYRGKTIDDPVIVGVIKNYATTCDAIKLFIDNMFLNPRWGSVEQLGRFLKHNNLPLTEDGCFLGYKAVRYDYKDKYTGTLNNSPGNTVVMPRKDVTFDPDIACSAGLHVGTHEYAKDFGCGTDRVVIVKVNPAHCVSVPFDEDAQKLRCSQYEVLTDCEGLLNTGIVYSFDGKQINLKDYFADRAESGYRRRRPKVALPPQPVIIDDDDDDDGDIEPYCDNCDEFDLDDFRGGAFCSFCGSELEWK